MRKQLITLGTAATMVLGGLALTSGSANAGTAAAAADRNFQASCTSAGKKFSVGVYYTPKDGYDRITSYSFSFKGSDIGDRNQVRLRIREEKVGPDKNLWQWESSKVTRSGHTRNPNIQVRYKAKWHADFRVVFDLKNDRSCTGLTNSA
jgi:hypothetical protein